MLYERGHLRFIPFQEFWPGLSSTSKVFLGWIESVDVDNVAMLGVGTHGLIEIGPPSALAEHPLLQNETTPWTEEE